MSKTAPILTLITDFGLKDEYVGVIKGVILTLAPEVRLVDISHLIPPQGVRTASHLLARSCAYFPPGTVHLVIVDPGVGTSRPILAIAADSQYFIGPDNGVFTPVFLRSGSLRVHRVTAADLFLDKVGATFHGRDIMAPIAARLAAGLIPLNHVGPRIPVEDCVHTLQRTCIQTGDLLQGEILHVDTFGNLCTNITRQEVARFGAGREIFICVNKIHIPFCHTYADQGKGKLLALYDSHDYLEIAINKGNAALELDMAIGSIVILSRHRQDFSDSSV